MPEPDDFTLLKQYAGGNESAFTALFERHVHLVYSAALRQARNPSHAEEVTQAVFILLARKAKSLSPKTVLSGWLYQAARLTTASLIKREIRRQRREQEVYMQSLTEPETSLWEQISPLLEDAMGRLGEKDRNAIVLRFFENRTPQEVAGALKLNEVNGAQTREPRIGKVADIFREARRGFDDGNHCRDNFGQFRAGRAGGAGQSRHGSRDCQRRGGFHFNFNPSERSIESYGLDKNENGCHHHGGGSFDWQWHRFGNL